MENWAFVVRLFEEVVRNERLVTEDWWGVLVEGEGGERSDLREDIRVAFLA